MKNYLVMAICLVFSPNLYGHSFNDNAHMVF